MGMTAGSGYGRGMQDRSRELERFAAVVQRDDADIRLDEAALLIGAWEHEAFDVAPHLRALDDLARRAAPALESATSPDAAGRALATTLFKELAFRGNTEAYYDPRNSFLVDVLDRHVGIPISLSVLYMEVARRLGLRAGGVAFPGHFLVRVDGGAAPLILDPFGGGAALNRNDLEALLAQSAGPEARLADVVLSPATNRAILVRMLNNLAGIYGRDGDTARSLEVLERVAALEPADLHIAQSIERLRRAVASLN
jgi:regulator of sirC expression with transglutaminase-like and TPR domain